MMFNVKEDLLKYLLSGAIHLSKKDYSFFHNLTYIISDKNTITSNQTSLFDKLIDKYQRQLKKENNDISKLHNLVWQTPVVESKKEYLQANFQCKDGKLFIKSPFNSRFIQDLRKLDFNNYVWNKTERVYSAPFSTLNLKQGVDLITKHFHEYELDDTITNILNYVDQYKDVKYWSPTLIKRNNSLFVVGANPYVIEAIKNIELKESAECLFELSQYGIKIDEELVYNSFLKFATNYNTSIDLDNFDEFCQWLNDLKIDTVITSRDIIYNKSISNEIKVKLLEHSITCLPMNSEVNRPYVLLTHYSHMWPNKNIRNDIMLKIVVLTNSRKVNIK